MEPSHNRSRHTEIGTKITAPFSVAAVGDLIMPQPLARLDPDFSHFTALIRNCDIGCANMESSLIDLPRFTGGAIAGTAAPLAAGAAIRDMGFSLLSRANNHTFDCGLMGMVSTDAALDRLGLTHAGTGGNLEEARAARFRETAKGRVALTSCYSLADTGHFGPTYERTCASSRNGSIGGMPGVNPLHVTAYNVVTPAQLQQMRELGEAAYGPRLGAHIPAQDGKPERLRFFDQWYQAGADAGAISYDMDPKDHKGILQAVTNGKLLADFLICAIHCHQTTRFDPTVAFGTVKGMREPLDHYPADFLRHLAHDAIDAGADMFVSHGVHCLAGIELYRGKPIFYGLSNFIFQFGLQYGASDDVFANFEKKCELENDQSHIAMLTTSHFDQGHLREIRLYPADLGGARRPLSQMGIPLRPDPHHAQRILEAVQSYSQPFGTQIAIEAGMGVIRVQP